MGILKRRKIEGIEEEWINLKGVAVGRVRDACGMWSEPRIGRKKGSK